MEAAKAKTVSEFLVADFENEIATTLRIIGAVPTDHLDYRPDAKAKTGLGLVRHIALEDEWLLTCIANGIVTPPPDDSDACGIMSPSDGVARYEQGVPAALARVRAMTGEQLTSSINFLDVMHMPGLVMLSMALKHSVHHRGQLSSYLRAMGGSVPAIYGPSADTP